MDGSEATKSKGMIRAMAGGHRDDGLQAADRAVLQRRIGDILDLVARWSQETPRLIVSLAEGADRLFVTEALARRWPVTAVLPFARDEFARDFESGASKQEYRQLMAQADRVVELPAMRDEEGDGAAYAAANQEMLDQADLLLTVWDGEPARGPGGTAEVVAQARARGIPVVWISTEPPHEIHLFDPAETREPVPWWGQLAADLAQPAARSSTESG